MVDVSVIIVNYNVKEFLQNLLDSLAKASKNLTTEIIVIDNDSKDGSVEIVREKYPHVNLIASKKNLGFGAANNLGLELSTGKYILLINPDTIVREDTLTKMIEFFENNPDAGMAGCKVLNPDGTLQLPCRRGFPGPWTSFTKVTGLSKLFPKSKLFAKYNLTYLDENESYEVDAISGAFMFLKREVYETIGGFDPVFFMYGEDLDLCYRTQSSGFKVYYNHETEIIHYKGESTKRSNMDETRVFYDAMTLFVKKHFSSSFIVEWILRLAIVLRKFVAFLSIFRIPLISILIDFALFSGVIYTTEYFYFQYHFPPEVRPYVYFIPAIIQVIIFALAGVYRKKSFSILRSLGMMFGGLIILSAFTFFFKQWAFSRGIMLITYATLMLLYPFWRIVAKIVFKLGVDKSYNKINTLVVGPTADSASLAGKIKLNVTSMHNIVGLVGNNYKQIGESVNGFKVVGVLENIEKLIAANKINKVIFSSDELSFQEMFMIVSKCQGLNVDFAVAGNEHDFLVGKSAITILDNIPLVKLNYNISQPDHKFLKRLFDIFLAFPILILLYPFVALMGLVGGNKNDFVKFFMGVPKVLMGKLSFVGPQPEHIKDDLYFGKPGLTGLWKTEDIDENDLDDLNKLNIFYARNQNIWLDIEILSKTFTKMIF